jgi:hypothetical protein
MTTFLGLWRNGMSEELLRFDGILKRDPAIDAWLKRHKGELGAMARRWFEVMRGCGDEVREVFHDGCANACLGDVPFGYVNVFTAHVNVGFLWGGVGRSGGVVGGQREEDEACEGGGGGG